MRVLGSHSCFVPPSGDQDLGLLKVAGGCQLPEPNPLARRLCSDHHSRSFTRRPSASLTTALPPQLCQLLRLCSLLSSATYRYTYKGSVQVLRLEELLPWDQGLALVTSHLQEQGPFLSPAVAFLEEASTRRHDGQGNE
jgi:hypothetical protein